MKQEFNRAMDQVTLPPEAEARIISVLEGKTAGSPPRRPGRRWKTAAAAAAAAILMTGAAFAAAYQAGVLDLFFQGDTGSLEPYVQTTIPSAEHEGYRLTVDNSLYDGQNLYILMTVEALNQQAASELEHLRIASPTPFAGPSPPPAPLIPPKSPPTAWASRSCPPGRTPAAPGRSI